MSHFTGAAPQVQGGAVPAIDTIRRDEVNAVLANQRELVSAARDIKNFVTDVHSKVSNIQQNQARGQGSVQPVGGSQGAGQGDMAYVQQVSHIRQFQQGFTHNKAFLTFYLLKTYPRITPNQPKIYSVNGTPTHSLQKICRKFGIYLLKLTKDLL